LPERPEDATAMSRATDLLDVWRSIASPPRGSLAGRRVPDLSPELRIWVAVDSGRTPYLLVQVPPEIGQVSLERTRGLEVTVSEMRIGDEPTSTYLALACLDENLTETFAALCGDVADALDRQGGDPVTTTQEIVRRWRRFWQITGAQLSRDECLGLFGELWFMERWIGLPAGVSLWTAPGGARHDFQSPRWSVEVKSATRTSDGVVRHIITGIDQLADPETGQLYVFSLQVAPDELASNTLPSLVSRLADSLSLYPDARDAFLDGLSRRRYSPADAERYGYRWRVLREELYQVAGNFPRIVPASFSSGLPAGIGGLTYVLDMAACSEWRVAIRPEEASSLLFG
jgi:hypothetical protein